MLLKVNSLFMLRKNYIGMGYQFHQLVRESISEMIKEGNKTSIFSDFDENQSEEDSWKEYESKTRWNDFNIGIPLLFNFYHGLELLMKGILQELGVEVEKNHNIKTLFETISTHSNIPKELLKILKKYLFNENPFLDFFQINNTSIFKYHLLLKYPESNGNSTHNYSKIRGKGKEGLGRFISLKEDISKMKHEITKWNKSRNLTT